MSQVDDDDKDLEYTRQVRMDLIKSMTKTGMPTDNRDRMTLLSTLDGIDRVAIAKKKIKSDEGISNSKAMAAETIAMLFMDPRLKKTLEVKPDETREIPKLRNDLETPKLVEGELEITQQQESYDSFMSKYGLNLDTSDDLTNEGY